MHPQTGKIAYLTVRAYFSGLEDEMNPFESQTNEYNTNESMVYGRRNEASTPHDNYRLKNSGIGSLNGRLNNLPLDSSQIDQRTHQNSRTSGLMTRKNGVSWAGLGNDGRTAEGAID